MAGKETRYKDAYELIDRQKEDNSKKEYRKLSRRRPAKTLRTIAAGVAFLLTLTALVLVVAFRIDTVNRLEQNQETQMQISEQSSSQKVQQDNVNEEFEELLNDFNEIIHNRLNNSQEVIKAFRNASNITVNMLRFQLRNEIQELFQQLHMSNKTIREEITTADQALQNQVDSLNEDVQEKFSEERQVRGDVFTILQNQLNEANDSIKHLGLTLEQQIENIGLRITNVSEAILLHINSSQGEILNTISKLQCPGLNQHNPAISCQQISDCDPSLKSGFYWLLGADLNRSVNVYCEFDWTCENHTVTGSWRRVKYLDMRNGVHTCPPELITETSPSLRCGNPSRGCHFVNIETNQIPYNKVCGKIIGYKTGNPDGFWGGNNLDSIDGISLSFSIHHIWTFTAADLNDQCLCNDNTPVTLPEIVGNNYFCTLNRNDLWDRNQCETNTDKCCDFNEPPWFYREFNISEPIIDNIQLRVCLNEGVHNEQLFIEQVEIYVQ